MFNSVNQWWGRAVHPVGIDFGTDCVRLAQVDLSHSESRLIAAASVDVPEDIRDATRGNDAQRLEFLTDVIADFVRTEPFHGRKATLALPAAMSFVQPISLNQTGDSAIDAAMQAEVSRFVPADSKDLLVRHQSMFTTVDGRREMLAVGADRSAVVDLLAAVHGAGLDVISMNTEAGAIGDLFRHVYQRHFDRAATSGLIDIGYSGTRLFIFRDHELVGASTVPIGGRHLTQAVADSLKLSVAAGRMMRLKHSRAEATAVQARESHVLFVAPPAGGIEPLRQEADLLDRATAPTIQSLCNWLRKAVSDFQSSPAGTPMDRLLFLGGESRDRRLCQRLARHVGITACTGDPLLRMGRLSKVCVDSGIDRRHAQPAWCVAIGMSVGPVSKETSTDDVEPENLQRRI